jgi:hypothetical protein
MLNIKITIGSFIIGQWYPVGRLKNEGKVASRHLPKISHVDVEQLRLWNGLQCT